MLVFRSRKRKRSPKPDLNQSLTTEQNQQNQETQETQENHILSSTLAENLTTIQTIFANCTDFVYRELKIGQEQVPVLLLFVNGITDEQTVNQDILKSLVNIRCSNLEVSGSNNFEMIKNVFLEIGNITEISTIGEVADAVLTGSVALLLEGTVQSLKNRNQGFCGSASF